ncbi:PspC domain-containing protein [Thermococcus thioreducens]|nr:PspC domain-containing protein [Thermococcus thioreducens]SEV80632.1 phage shock protein C (PspC) family protein [Thermococcus thioreducens]
MAKKLVRSKKDRMFLGVLGGIAEPLNVDPTLVRLIFVVLLVFNPAAMTLLYFLAALVIPEEEREEEKSLSERIEELIGETGERLEDVISGNENYKAVALLLILLGAILLAGPFMPFLLPAIDFRTLLAVVFLVIGIILLLRGE